VIFYVSIPYPDVCSLEHNGGSTSHP
jgi:hypothetical protein